MQRSKQQALMFVLGAALVGGALGFSADRYMVHEKVVTQFGPRARFYDAIGLTQTQRATLDSLAFEQECAMKVVLAPHDSALKAIRTRFRAQRDSVFTKEQLVKLDQRRKDMQARVEAEQAKEPKRQCSPN
jgi:hypothetical protein